MKVKNIKEISPIPSGAYDVQKRILLGKDDGCNNFIIRLFEQSPGGHGFMHHHDYEHGIFVLRGKAKLTIDTEEQQVKEGDTFLIPSGKLHTMENTGDQPFVFICIIPGYAWEEKRVFVDQETLL